MSHLFARAVDEMTSSSFSASSAASAHSTTSVASVAAGAATGAAAVMDGLAAAVAGNPLKSEVFFGLALLVLSLAVLLILRYYLPLRSTPAYLLVPVFFALWLPANIVLLVPIDLASSAQTDDEATRGIWLPQVVLRVAWRTTYWLTFALTWFILPILAEYSDAGYREPQDRILYSLRENAQYHALVFGSGLAGLAYVTVVYGLSPTSLKGLVMALAYCWGLFLAIYLMGHGLVAIPRRLLRTATPSRRLRRLQTLAPRAHEKLEEAEFALAEVERQVAALGRRKTGSALDFRAWIDDLNDTAASPLASLPAGADLYADDAGRTGGADAGAGADADARIVPTVITKKFMADLTRRLVRARHTRLRYLSEWNRLLQRYAETQAVLNSAGSKRLEAGSRRHGGGGGSAGASGSVAGLGDALDRLSLLTPYTRYVLYYHVVPAGRVALGGLLAAASAAIVWSELVKAVLPSASVIRLTVVHHWTGDKGQVGFAGQLIATLWILYMCAAALTSVTEVKVWRGRALVQRNTAHESAFWYASQVARLSVPLTYNFMTFLSKSVYEKTVFYDFLGRLITFTRLGTWFDYLLPTFILLPVLATLFGLYGRVRRCFGFGDLAVAAADDEEEAEAASMGADGRLRSYGTGSWREGRDLIERELNGTSIRQRRLAAAAAAGGGSSSSSSSSSSGRGSGPQGGRHYDAYDDDPEGGGGGAPTTPFAVSPSSSGILPPPPPPPGGGRTFGGGPAAGRRQRPPYDVDHRGDGYDDDGEDDNIFQMLGHRMKNTVDTLTPPKWFQEIGQGIKAPKWMSSSSGGGGGGGSGTSRSAAPASDGNGIRRWFGGSDGRIRL